MPDKLDLGNLTANIKVIEGIRYKWGIPPEEGEEIKWWEIVGKRGCALCSHMDEVYGGNCCNICPLNDPNVICCDEFEDIVHYINALLEESDFDREMFCTLFSAMHNRIFALKTEDISMIVDSDVEKEE